MTARWLELWWHNFDPSVVKGADLPDEFWPDHITDSEIEQYRDPLSALVGVSPSLRRDIVRILGQASLHREPPAVPQQSPPDSASSESGVDGGRMGAHWHAHGKSVGGVEFGVGPDGRASFTLNESATLDDLFRAEGFIPDREGRNKQHNDALLEDLDLHVKDSNERAALSAARARMSPLQRMLDQGRAEMRIIEAGDATKRVELQRERKAQEQRTADWALSRVRMREEQATSAVRSGLVARLQVLLDGQAARWQFADGRELADANQIAVAACAAWADRQAALALVQLERRRGPRWKASAVRTDWSGLIDACDTKPNAWAILPGAECSAECVRRAAFGPFSIGKLLRRVGVPPFNAGCTCSLQSASAEQALAASSRWRFGQVSQWGAGLAVASVGIVLLLILLGVFRGVH